MVHLAGQQITAHLVKPASPKRLLPITCIFPAYYGADIKLAQNYYRDYSAELGRYVESDPIGLDGGVNFYSYVEQNPYFIMILMADLLLLLQF